MSDGRSLELRFHGRIIDQLGIQMYQSPVAAIAELVSNSWDADAQRVAVQLPSSTTGEFVITDNGSGMTWDDCQDRFLAVGYDRRLAQPETRTQLGRPVLGRKGIGKFAGFGIARVIEIDTISQETGERTVFELDQESLKGDYYVSTESKAINVIEYYGPDEVRKSEHGTIVRLRHLLIDRTPNPVRFSESMSRRFLLQQLVDNFEVLINSTPLPSSDSLEGVQYVFPKELDRATAGERLLETITLCDDGSGNERLSSGELINWRFVFYKEPVPEPELRGIAVFAHGKLAQTPFFFNLSGGISAQHGLEYLAGRVQADFIDEQPADLISPERQRVDWEDAETAVLKDWGQKRIRAILSIWRTLRGEERAKQISLGIERFQERLEALARSERRTVERALVSLGRIESLSDERYLEVAGQVLTAWEQGKLRGLIDDIAQMSDLDEEKLVEILTEVESLTLLQIGESVKTRLEVILRLEQRIKNRENENPLRDHIAEHPWLIGPRWETFSIERSIPNVIQQAVDEAKLNDYDDWKNRIDLVLSSGDRLLVLEFMKPGVSLDHDHLERFGLYCRAVDTYLRTQTAGTFKRLEAGILVADRINKSPVIAAQIEEMAEQRRYAMDWSTLISNARSQWSEQLDLIADRGIEDKRVQQLIGRGAQEERAIIDADSSSG